MRRAFQKIYRQKQLTLVVFFTKHVATKTVEGKTSFDTWNDYKSSLKNFKIICYLCFFYISHIKRDKLDKKVELGVFIDYSKISKAY